MTPLCDFCFPAHPIHGKVHTVAAAEISAYARAYAEMITAEFPLVIRVNTLREIVRYAREKPIRTGEIMHGQHGDWATCKQHLRVWQEWKRRFPAERYPKGTEG